METTDFASAVCCLQLNHVYVMVSAIRKKGWVQNREKLEEML